MTFDLGQTGHLEQTLLGDGVAALEDQIAGRASRSTPMAGAAHERSVAGTTPQTPRSHAELLDLANLSWPDGPLTAPAADFADVEDIRTEATLHSLFELCGFLGRRDIVLLNAEDLTRDELGGSMLERAYLLQCLIYRTFRALGATPPRLTLKRRGAHFDLKIELKTC